MINAQTELLTLMLRIKTRIKCAHITKGHEWEDNRREILLPVDYSDGDYQRFLMKLNFLYDEGYGSQELFGIIWLEDGAWCTRGEYDGSEWWDYNALLDIPLNLLFPTKEVK